MLDKIQRAAKALIAELPKLDTPEKIQAAARAAAAKEFPGHRDLDAITAQVIAEAQKQPELGQLAAMQQRFAQATEMMSTMTQKQRDVMNSIIKKF